MTLIGINMIRESRGEAENLDACFTFQAMVPLAIATSIDALAVGVTFAFFESPDSSGSSVYRNYYFCDLLRRCADRKPFWRKVQIKSRTGRRYGADPDGN